MFRRSPFLKQTNDPMFIRRIKRTYAKYAATMETQHNAAISKEAFVDIDEKGPAWYLGHMARTRRILEEKIASDAIDFFIEMRDARLPFTTENPHITELSEQRPRIIVFNKADLANEEMNRLIHRHFEDAGHYTLFTAASRSWKDTVEAVQRFVLHVLPQKEFKLAAHVGCIVGMPNVGKSTLINSLRMAHEFQFHREDFRRPRGGEEVSMAPGTTTSVKLVPMSRDPNVVLHDTPGLTLPGNVHKEAGLKLCACGVIPSNSMTLSEANVARYIYEVLHAAGANEHLAECLHLSRAPVSFDDCSVMLCERSGKFAQSAMGANRLRLAHQFMMHDFMLGKLGRITLDKLPKKMLPSLAENSKKTNSSTSTDQQQQQQQQQSQDSEEFVMEHEVESYDVNYSTSFAKNSNNAQNPGESSSSSSSTVDPSSRTADPKYLHSVMTTIHAGPDHDVESVISRKKGLMSRENILTSMGEHTILRSHHLSTNDKKNNYSSSNAAGATTMNMSSKKRSNGVNNTSPLQRRNLSEILQKRV